MARAVARAVARGPSPSKAVGNCLGMAQYYKFNRKCKMLI